MDEGFEAGVGFVGAPGEAFELLERAGEVFDQMTPFGDLRVERPGLCPAGVLCDEALGPPLLKGGDDGIAVEGLVGGQRAERDAVEARRRPPRSKRRPGSSSTRTRLPSASLGARILVVQPPLERPMAWR